MKQSNFETLLQIAYVQSFPQGMDLIRQGDPADFLHIVIEGAVELYAEWDTRQCTMAVVKPYGTFILAATIRDAPYLMSARTLERSRVVMLPATDLRAVFREDSAFAVSVIHELAGCYRTIVRHAKGLKLRTARERIASYLLRQSRISGNVASYLLPVEKRLLASYLGMTPENLSRSIKTLEAEGVKIDGQRVIITDAAKLARLAKPDLLIDGPDPDATGMGSSLPPVRTVSNR